MGERKKKMTKFKIGETVIARHSNISGEIVKGKEYIVDGFTCCSGCGIPCLYLKGMTRIANLICGNSHHGCGYKKLHTRECYAESCFEKPISLAETTEYKLKVSIPELIEIKEPQLQWNQTDSTMRPNYFNTTPTLSIERMMADHKFHFNRYLECVQSGNVRDRKYHSSQAKRIDAILTGMVDRLKEAEK